MPDPERLAAAIDGLLHEPTQVTDRGVDLSVASVHRLDGPGRVDFGGGELEPAETAPVETERRNPGDDYGWWTLDPGGYLLEHNEGLDATVRLEPRPALCARGAFHPTLTVDELPRVPLFVGDGGLRLKENARVTTVVARAD